MGLVCLEGLLLQKVDFFQNFREVVVFISKLSW